MDDERDYTVSSWIRSSQELNNQKIFDNKNFCHLPDTQVLIKTLELGARLFNLILISALDFR